MPANWELHGFAEPHYYMDLQDGVGLYRRTFRASSQWKGRLVCLRFEGVAYAFEVWLNGKKVGASDASAFNPNIFDITGALNSEPNADNVLAVRVITRAVAWQSDANDDWDLSGIFRDVSIFSLPQIHLQDVTTETKLTAAGVARLSVAVAVSQAGGEVRAKLISPDGRLVTGLNFASGGGGLHKAEATLEKPRLWTAETPSLYHLQIVLLAEDRELQSCEVRVGIREISIVDGVLCLNGIAIKLRGVNWVPENPLTGRVVTVENERRDLELMKKANINFVRVAHFPPNRSFLDLCDEMGIYVFNPVPLSHFQSGKKNDPAYRENVKARVRNTLRRDKNHASVIIWGIGNESSPSEFSLELGRLTKDLDPTRPICYPLTPTSFHDDYMTLPEFVDLYDEHYPTTVELLDLAQELDRPAIFSEYAHANALATGKIQDQWAIMQAMPRLAGGAIWDFADQGLLRASKVPLDPDKPTPYVWPDKDHYYDTHGLDGCDGIVYADRTPQTDYWQVRKVYSPIQLSVPSLEVKPGTQSLAVAVENRYDFRTLKGMRIAWSLLLNQTEKLKGELPLSAAARKTEVAHVPMHIPAFAVTDVLSLNLRCLDDEGDPINEHSVKLHSGSGPGSWPDMLPTSGVPALADSSEDVSVSFARGKLTLKRSSGALTVTGSSGRVLIAGIYPHCGRRLTGPEEGRAKRSGTWRTSMLTVVENLVIDAKQVDSGVHISVSGRYPRPGAGEQSFVGSYQLNIGADGAIAVNYSYTPTNATGELAEAGLSIVVPREMSEFHWIGQGPYPGYPGKDRLDEFGLFHLNRDDLRFQGNRRDTELAALSSGEGVGLAMVTKPVDVAVERNGGNILLSHSVAISGLGSKGNPPDHFVDAGTARRMTGNLTLVAFENLWPDQLTHWFGEDSRAKDVFRPFYASYDQ